MGQKVPGIFLQEKDPGTNCPNKKRTMPQQPALRRYNIDVLRYAASVDIQRPKLVNGFTVTNLGDTPFLINGKILFPSATPATAQGDSMSFGGNEGEIYIGKMTLAFIAPIGAQPICEVVYKTYLEEDQL